VKPLIRTIIATLFIAAHAVSAGATTLKHHQAKSTAKHQHVTRKAATLGPAYATRPDVINIATEIAQRSNLDPHWVQAAIRQAHYIPSIARAITPSAVGTPKNWAVYRSRFIDAVRIKAGVKFWEQNRAALERAQTEFGVPASIIVGIIGVETIYGQQVGTYRVMDALCTLAFDFPKEHPRSVERSAFFLSELEAFLSLTQRMGTDPLSPRGSYAGAMGLPQFMPSSWNKYAVDFDRDGRTDLFNSPEDVIGSVANYLKSFKWQPGMPTHYRLQFDMQKLDMPALMAPDILPTFSASALAVKGVVLEGVALVHVGPLALVELQNGDAAPLYIIGTENFYAITRYNWSSYYAMAVIELGQEVAAAMTK
jgi:membrane-bound lytic murein transglycosylase B